MTSFFSERRRALVVGAGVSGLTTARCLQEVGFAVTVVADRFQRATTSTVAGALWEWPPAVCGFYETQPEAALKDEQRWCVASYIRFKDLAASDAGAGVFMRPVVFYLDRPAAADPFELRKMGELRPHVGGFAHDADLIQRHGVNPDAGFVDAYTYETPLVDTDTYMAWLLSEVLAHGGTVERRRVEGDLADVAPELRDAYRADVVVNCGGLGARQLAGDGDVIPVRGAWILVENDGRRFPKITTAHASSLTTSSAGGNFVFIIPRGRDRLILGGVAQPNRWEAELGRDDEALMDEIHRRCVTFMPSLAAAEVRGRGGVRVGLRPFRRGGVRVERESGAAVVHNYGHGGSGVTLSWGAARDAALLALSLFGDAGVPLGTVPGPARDPLNGVTEVAA